jgi:hypothetical protein
MSSRSTGVLGDDHYNHQPNEADEERMHEEQLDMQRNWCLNPATFVSVVQARLVEALPTLTCCNVVGKQLGSTEAMARLTTSAHPF